MLENCESDPACDNWVSWVKTEIYSLGFEDFWVSQESISDQIGYFSNMAKQRITDHYMQSLRATLDCSSKSHIYKHVVSTFSLQPYLTKPIPKRYKTRITKLRLSSLNIATIHPTDEVEIEKKSLTTLIIPLLLDVIKSIMCWLNNWNPNYFTHYK